MAYKTFGEIANSIQPQGIKTMNLIFIMREPWYYKGVTMSIHNVMVKTELMVNDKKELVIMESNNTFRISTNGWEDKSALYLDVCGTVTAFIDPYKAIRFTIDKMNAAKRSESLYMRQQHFSKEFIKRCLQTLEDRKNCIIDQIYKEIINDDIR